MRAQEKNDMVGAFFDAVKNGQTNIVQQSLLNDTNLVRSLYYRRFPLHVAASKGHLGIVDLLLKAGADINSEGDTLDTSGHRLTALEISVWYNHPILCKWLLGRGANPNHTSFPDGSALHMAFAYKRPQMAEWLLDAGANALIEIPSPRQKATPFEMAILQSDGKLIPRMLEGRRWHPRDTKQGAVALKDKSVVPMFDELTVKFLNTNGSTLVTAAAVRGELEAVEALLQAGVPITNRTTEGYSTLQSFSLASSGEVKAGSKNADRYRQILDLLLRRGADYDIFAATGLGDENTVRRLLSVDTKLVRKCDHLGDTALHWAVRADQLAMTDFWLKSGVSVAETNIAGQTSGHIAAARGLKDQLTRLISAGAPLDVRDQKGATPFDVASQAKQAETIRLLLQAGTPVAKSVGIGVTTPVHEAVATGNLSALTSLANSNNVNARNELGFTPFHLAMQRGQLGAAALLLDKGADVNARDSEGNTALLQVLAKWGYYVTGWPAAAWLERQSLDPAKARYLKPLVEKKDSNPPFFVVQATGFLLASGADVSAVNNAGKSAVKLALDPSSSAFEDEHTALLKLLRQGGADLIQRDAEGNTPLHLAMREILPDQAEQLIAAGVDLNATNGMGRTPVHVAVEKLGSWGEATPFVLLLAAKPNVNARDNKGLTPLHVLVMSDSSFIDEATKALSAAGADPNIRDNLGRTPIHIALSGNWPWHGASRSLKLLVNAGGKLDIADAQGRTPLHYVALMNGQNPVFFAREVFGILESAKLDFNATDKAGDTPLHLAARSGATDVFEWLRNHGARLDVTNAAGETPRAEAGRRPTPLSPFQRLNLGPTKEIADAARRGEVEVLRRWLTSEPALANATNHLGQTALMIAADAGQAKAADVLVEFGAAWDPASATKLGRADLLKDLLSRGGVSDSSKRVLLLLAAESGNVRSLELLLATGAELNASASSGLSPLGIALQKGHAAAAGLLRNRGASENVFDAVILDLPERTAALFKQDKSCGQVTNAYRFTPVHIAVALERTRILNILLDGRGAANLTTDGLQTSPLHIAAACNRTNAASLLLRLGAQIEARDALGCTPLHNAAACGSTETVALLLRKGADPEAALKAGARSAMSGPYRGPTAGNTALHFAAITGRTNIMALLLKAHADVNALNERGQTPLDAAWSSQSMGPVPLPGASLRLLLSTLKLNDSEKIAEVKAGPTALYPAVTAKFLEQAGGKSGAPNSPLNALRLR